jgi:Mn2+/Fe2+ NRAMP family transporter
MLKRLKQIGPGAMVAAAFIGPGTVTTATLAGARYGYTLLWAVLFSVIATYVLQEMSARLGIGARLGLGEAIRQKVPQGLARVASAVLVLGAILIGNAAYEAGNITGAVLGFIPLFDFTGLIVNPLVFVIGFLAFALLFSGKYKLIERSLIIMVSVMGFVFLVAAFFAHPDPSAILKGLLVPSVPKGGLVMVLGLIGTTVVPYNLFLHSSVVRERWKSSDNMDAARYDTLISIVLGGVITAAIVISAAVAFAGQGEMLDATDLSAPLKPFLGVWAKVFIAFGFLAAGLSSSITAPLAAAYATCGVMGWPSDLKNMRFRLIWAGVLVVGIFFASLGFKPLTVILFAQVANGVLLPVIAGFLLWIMNDQGLMGAFTNSGPKNILGFLVVSLTLMLGLKSIMAALF